MIYLSISSDDNWCCVGWWMVTDNLEWITDLTRDGERTHLQPHNSPPSLPPHWADPHLAIIHPSPTIRTGITKLSQCMKINLINSSSPFPFYIEQFYHNFYWCYAISFGIGINCVQYVDVSFFHVVFKAGVTNNINLTFSNFVVWTYWIFYEFYEPTLHQI